MRETEALINAEPENARGLRDSDVGANWKKAEKKTARSFPRPVCYYFYTSNICGARAS